MSRILSDNFRQYVSTRYGAKGRRSIRFSSRQDELEILLGVRDAPDFDDEDKQFLSSGQLEELEKLSNKAKDAKRHSEVKTHMSYEDDAV